MISTVVPVLRVATEGLVASGWLRSETAVVTWPLGAGVLLGSNVKVALGIAVLVAVFVLVGCGRVAVFVFVGSGSAVWVLVGAVVAAAMFSFWPPQAITVNRIKSIEKRK